MSKNYEVYYMGTSDAGNDLYMAGLPDGCRIEDSPDGEWAACATVVEWAAWDATVAEWHDCVKERLDRAPGFDSGRGT